MKQSQFNSDASLWPTKANKRNMCYFCITIKLLLLNSPNFFKLDKGMQILSNLFNQ